MDVLTPQQRSANMAAIKGKNTKPEISLRSIIHRLGYRYRLHRKDLPGKPDIVFPSRKKVIFVHGCYWHMHDCRFGNVIPDTRTEFWQTKRTGNVARDERHVKELKALGWDCLVVWACSLRDPKTVVREVRRFLGFRGTRWKRRKRI
jgi:DNA mismatch endonuclease (patch repair protein)